MTKDDLIWQAGFFDGEGNIHLRHSKPTYSNPKGQYTLWVHVSQTNEDVLGSFMKFGGHIYKRERVNQKHAACYTWRITGLGAKPFLEAILPYLRLKKEVVLIALKFIDTIMGGRKLGLSEDLIQQRDRLIEEYRRVQPLRLGMTGKGLKKT